MKLACLLFDFGVIPKALSTQPTMTVNNKFRRPHMTPLTSVDNTDGVTTVELCLQQLWSDSDAKSNRSRINVWTYFYLKPEISP